MCRLHKLKMGERGEEDEALVGGKQNVLIYLYLIII